MEKYYTPKIEEFHVGFEYEILQNGNYIKTTFLTQSEFGFDDVDDLINIARVKHLDKEDIESLGFKLIESDKSNYFGNLFSVTIPCKMGSLDTATYRLLLGQHSKVCLTIIESNSYGGNEQNMCLTIKNKSELKRLLKQLEI
tara:strand:- start:3886 stop:4311 length:426 start_codon:yes stop_codon:yes gene_type:complete